LRKVLESGWLKVNSYRNILLPFVIQDWKFIESDTGRTFLLNSHNVGSPNQPESHGVLAFSAPRKRLIF
jgi:hypothetical protein